MAGLAMTRDDITLMAREADDYADKVLNPGEFHPDWHEVRDAKFAALVAAAEREACAKVCDDLPMYGPDDETADWYGLAQVDCAAAIRARGQQ